MNRACAFILSACFACFGFGQVAKRDAPTTSEFALEFLSRHGGSPSYLQVPTSRGSLGVGSTGATSSGQQGLRKGVRFSVDHDPPGMLRIHISISDELGPDGNAGQDDNSWRKAGDYTLRISESEALTVPELEEYGFFQLKIIPAQLPMSSPPPVISVFKSLEVVKVEQGIRNSFRVFVRNLSDKPICALQARFSPNHLTGHGAGSTPVIESGQTKEFIYFVPSTDTDRPETQSGGAQRPLYYVAVYYGDGSCEGEPGVCARIAAKSEANRLVASREVAGLEEALTKADPESFLREARGRREPVDAEVIQQIVAQTLTRFPDAPPSSASELTALVESTVSNYDRYYGSVLDSTRRRDPNAAAPDIRKMIQNRIKERRAFVAAH